MVLTLVLIALFAVVVYMTFVVSAHTILFYYACRALESVNDPLQEGRAIVAFPDLCLYTDNQDNYRYR